MRADNNVRAIVPLLAALSFACGGTLGSNSSSVTSTGTGSDPRVELTVSSADWSTLLTQQTQCTGAPGGMQPGGMQPGGMQPGGQPPPEAIQACASLSANASCSVTTPDGKTLNGTCQTPPGVSQLACVPPPPPGGQMGPPPEAVQACANLAASAACSLTAPDGDTLNGTCQTPPGASQLVCVPQPPQAAIDACANLSADASCSMTTQDGKTLNGTCRTPPGASQLACVPPPPTAGPGEAIGGGAGGGVSGSLTESGGSATAVNIRLLPGSSDSTQRLAIAAQQDSSASSTTRTPPAFALLPPPPQGQAAPTGAATVHLYVDHGSGFVDFGTYLKVVPQQ